MAKEIPFYLYNDIITKTKLGELVNFMSQALKHEALNMIIPDKNYIRIDNPYSLFISMPALSQNLGLYINKVATFFARNSNHKLPSIHAIVNVFSSITGELIAILDGPAVTNLKCAAITAIVTDHCSSINANKLAIIGAGTQARQQLHGINLVRNIQELYLYNRSKVRLREFIHEIKLCYPLLKIIETNSIAECIASVDIISTTTSSSDPIDSFENLKFPVHINCMGSHTIASREIPNNVLESSHLIVEDVATAVNEAGALHAKALNILDMLNTNAQILHNTQTIFSSTGFALLDLITVAYLINELHSN